MNKILDQFDISGQHALITGGAGLLGQVFAGALRDAGAAVTLMDKDEKALDAALDRLQSSSDGVVSAAPCDITDERAVDATIEDLTKHKQVSILVNAAAVNPKFEPDECMAHQMIRGQDEQIAETKDLMS